MSNWKAQRKNTAFPHIFLAFFTVFWLSGTQHWMVTSGSLTCFQATTSGWVSTGQNLEKYWWEKVVYIWQTWMLFSSSDRCGLASSAWGPLSPHSLFFLSPSLPQKRHRSQDHELYPLYGITTSNGISVRVEAFSFSAAREDSFLPPFVSHIDFASALSWKTVNSHCKCYFSHFHHSIPVRSCSLGSESIVSKKESNILHLLQK